jgi:phosphomannomutase
MKTLIASISGVRGIVGEGLNPEVVLRYSFAFGNYCRSKRVVLGRDSRTSGEMLWFACVSGLLAGGCNVIDIGICPTPTVEVAVEKMKAGGGMVITASHNPQEWNGLKFIGEDGMFLSDLENRKLFKLAEKTPGFKPGCKWGRIHFDDSWIQKHIDLILKLKYIDKFKIKRRRPKVVIDCNNGAGSIIAPLLLQRLGCKTVTLNCVFSGSFSHPPEPVPENLTQLCKEVKRQKADLGFALDPDGDRLAIVSDKGLPLGEEFTLALATRFVLSRKPGNVAVNISTSRVLDDIANEYKAKLYRTKVGEAFVSRELKKIKGVIGGEGNGGIILPEGHYGRDGLVGMALILQYLTESNSTISELANELNRYFIVKRAIKLTKNFENRMRKLKEIHRDQKIDKIDGIKVNSKDAWVHVRKSNTEPSVRIIAEAESKKKALKLTYQMIKYLTRG